MTSCRYISATGGDTDLKGVLANKIVTEQNRIKAFRKTHGSKVVGEVNVDMVSFVESSA
jgi:hypothetical protein